MDALLADLVDFAGLFPPAAEDMRPALENYATYVESPDRAALGRFIVPILRLTELEEAGTDLMPRTAVRAVAPQRLVAEDVRSAIEEMQVQQPPFFTSGAGRAVIDVAEMGVRDGRNRLPTRSTGFLHGVFRNSNLGDVSPPVKKIAQVGARARFVRVEWRRGISLPPGGRRFHGWCQREAVPFKATAGLHHAVRSGIA